MLKKEKKEDHFIKKMFDICNFGWSLLIGAFVFLILFGGRRGHNRYKRRNHNKDKDDGKTGGGDIGSKDVSNDVPEHLEWSLDKRDRDFIRAALLTSALALLFCYLKNRKKCHYSEPLSQEGGVYYGEDEMINPLISQWSSEYGPSDLTRDPDLVSQMQKNVQNARVANARLAAEALTRRRSIPTMRDGVIIVSNTPENSMMSEY